MIEVRAQYAAVTQMRWRMLLNSLRSGRGRFELGARVATTGFFLLIWLVAGIGLGSAAWQFVSHGHLDRVASLLWVVLALWQLFPFLVAAAQERFDLGLLLRFPVSFGSYISLYLLLGVFDLASLLGGISLLGIGVGVFLAEPRLALWVGIAVSLFAAFNYLLARAISAWLERWLAQRRTREILGTVFVLLLAGLQFLNPAFRSSPPTMKPEVSQPVFLMIDSVKAAFPPSLAGKSIDAAERGNFIQATALLAGVATYAIATALLLCLRLRAEYRGEKFSEAPLPTPSRGHVKAPHRFWDALMDGRWNAGPIPAILAKEFRYLFRSSVLLLGLLASLLFFFAMTKSMMAGNSPGLRYAFPLSLAYAFLPMTRLFCNSLGGEGSGIQLYFLSPTPLRTVMLAKNLLQTGVLLIEVAVVWTILIFRTGPPDAQMVVVTFAWLLFALPLQLALGNVLSITMAYRMTLSRLSREQGSVGNGLMALAVQLLVFGVGATVYLLLARIGHPRLALPVFLLLAAPSVLFWLRMMANIDGMAARRREQLMGALARAT